MSPSTGDDALATGSDAPAPPVLLVSGSTRRLSTNTSALLTLRDTCPFETADLYDRLADLPAFNPDLDREPLPAAVRELRRRVDAAAFIVFSTPEYAGTLPGSFKNLLDWLVGGTEILGKPVAWLSVAAPGRGRNAIVTLETVLSYVEADLRNDLCLTIEVPRQAIGPDGISDPAVVAALRQFWTRPDQPFAEPQQRAACTRS